MEPNPKFVSSLANKLQRFHVDDESVFWALREMIQANVPLVATEKSHVGPSVKEENQ